ncbi:hypothetical protein RG47T_1186 [Mucilaginibacter polytrichastri]|uniref:Uncharacterized protein n=1 Tax=Mucilaginibacter polytrichastri TaxID=1302689 RepID=A0A1Q5ZVG1_9SPHI|nr:hypothetical protein RG47T_1186 [Mucilaginibacter polytrichastri]
MPCNLSSLPKSAQKDNHMKIVVNTGSIILPKNTKQWKLHQNIGKWACDLNRLQDAQEVQNNRAQSAPLGQLPMVF